jgi:hypothetical protein
VVAANKDIQCTLALRYSREQYEAWLEEAGFEIVYNGPAMLVPSWSFMLARYKELSFANRKHRPRRVHTGACQTSPGHRSSTANAIPCADLNEVKVCPSLAPPERVVLDRRRLARQDSKRERPVNALESKLNLGQQLARPDYKANELG